MASHRLSRRARFAARQTASRRLAKALASAKDGWALAQLKTYRASGAIGPDLGQWIDWYWGRGAFSEGGYAEGGAPIVPLGSLVAFHRARGAA